MRASLILLLAGCPAFAAELASYDAALAKQSPAILKHLRDKGYKNVGVLKFLVRQGDDGKLSDDAGDLNLTLANKLETALVLANTEESFGIIDRASEAVMKEKLGNANHRTEEGRKAFFTRKYELGWTRDKVTPAAFLTGTATIADGLKSMKVQLHAFDANGTIVDLPEPLTVASDPELLGQAGFSFATPKPVAAKAFVSGMPPEAKQKLKAEAVETIRETAQAKEPKEPLDDSPIRITILYNEQPVKVTKGRVPEPKAGDRIAFTLTNVGEGTHAAVLLVNGQNTLYNETLAPLACRKWVLEPGMEVTVRGFQTDAETASAFRVTKPDEPVEDAVRYGPHAGTYRLVVFAGAMGMDVGQPMDLKEDDRNRLALANTRGAPASAGAKPQSLKALQRDLRGRTVDTTGSRGYVVKGNTAEKFETMAVNFLPHAETPVADVSVKYIEAGK